MPATIRTMIAMPMLIRIGEKIHHHDQVATTPTLASLSVRKISVKIVGKGKKLVLFDFCDIYYIDLII
jgi:hypothetical protein